MAKHESKGFADKTSKALRDYKKHCAICSEPIEFIKHIVTVTDSTTKSIRFKEKMVGVCKCNRSEIYK
jgi:hypothetical protein